MAGVKAELLQMDAERKNSRLYKLKIERRQRIARRKEEEEKEAKKRADA